MSARGGPLDDADDAEIRAGEFVLCLLDGAGADGAAPVRADVSVGAVRRWERDFAPLLEPILPVEPPSSLWFRLARSAFGADALAPARDGRARRA